MKWQGNNEKAVDRMNQVVLSVFKGRGLLVLTTLTAIAITAAASFKWGG